MRGLTTADTEDAQRILSIQASALPLCASVSAVVSCLYPYTPY
jgi:hypothetical protein